ncbi:MAG TPA: glycosyltransferase, partial [Acidimicrobiales bacterium]|nr:glycosyltransferase [Acidimicrobiales bacterium]
MQQTSLSVVVPTRDRPALLGPCLESLRSSLRPEDELIVVDSASRDPVVAAVASAHGARVVRCERPGSSRARNAGAAAAGRDVIAFVDDDVRVAVSWADGMAKTFEDASVAFVTGRVGVPPDQVATAERAVAVKDDAEPCRLDGRCIGVIGSSASFAIRRDALARVGGFDESLGPGGRLGVVEDLDLFDRLFAAGMVGRYEPAARAWHDQWRTRPQLLRMDWQYGRGAGARLAKLVRTDPPGARS